MVSAMFFTMAICAMLRLLSSRIRETSLVTTSLPNILLSPVYRELTSSPENFTPETHAQTTIVVFIQKFFSVTNCCAYLCVQKPSIRYLIAKTMPSKTTGENILPHDSKQIGHRCNLALFRAHVFQHANHLLLWKILALGDVDRKNGQVKV